MSNSKVPSIPQPLPTLPGLVSVCSALKAGIEMLTGVTGTMLNQAVTFADIVRLGLADQPTVLSPTGRVAYASSTTLVQKYAITLGDGSTTSFTISHQLNTIDVMVAAYATASPYALLPLASVERKNTNQTVVAFQAAPPTGGARVMVIG